MTQIVCHRGACRHAPENTLPSAEKALALGGSIIELDIRQSRDGVLYVMHDETVDRTTDGSGPIAELISAEVDALDAGSWFAPEFAGTRVPRLETYLAALSDRAGFYLEVKQADCGAIGHLVRKLGIADQCFTFSFDPAMREGMLKEAPEVRRMIHWSRSGSVKAVRSDHKAAIVEFHAHDFDLDVVRLCQQGGLQVMLFRDEADEPRFRQALNLGMDYVNIDFVEDFAALRAKHKPSL
ncbi:MAG: glycerophosphodiester phosphodiesterase family protein [Pseudomonadota bacterium]